MPFYNKQCPVCQGTDLTYAGRPQVARSGDHEGDAILPMNCEDCGASWVALYRIAGYTALTPATPTKP